MHLRAALLPVATCVLLAAAHAAQTPLSAPGDGAPRLAILSPNHPSDTRGETVYEVQGEKQKEIAVVPGVFAVPKPIDFRPPDYPKSLRKKKADADVTVEGVVTADGAFIDTKIIEEVAPDVAASALASTAKYRFQPATLDGKPIALLLRIQVRYRIR